MAWYWWALIGLAVVLIEVFKVWYLSRWMHRQFEEQSKIEEILREGEEILREGEEILREGEEILREGNGNHHQNTR